MRIRVFAHDANIEADKPKHKLSFARALDAIKRGQIYQIDERTAKEYPPYDDATTAITRLGWNPSKMSVWWRRCALNEGRSGQFPIGYPIPHAYEGHLAMPKAKDINAPCPA